GEYIGQTGSHQGTLRLPRTGLLEMRFRYTGGFKAFNRSTFGLRIENITFLPIP
ncbi:hypothetical protein HDU91_001718, partial [Kappamyces sp. JEL0680]